MTTKQMDCILELARTLNFNRAAENLFISQPTMTYQVSEAEAEIGFRIFERSGRGAYPGGETVRDGIERNPAPLEKSDRAGAEFQRPVFGGYLYLASNPLGGLFSSGGYPALLRFSSVRVRHSMV